jgi:hypothetical protein
LKENLPTAKIILFLLSIFYLEKHKFLMSKPNSMCVLQSLLDKPLVAKQKETKYEAEKNDSYFKFF